MRPVIQFFVHCFVLVLFTALFLTGGAVWVTGWFVTLPALFGVFLMFVAIIGGWHSDKIAQAMMDLFPLQQPGQPAPAGQTPQLSPIANAVTTAGGITLADLALLWHDIEAKQHLYAAGVTTAQQQNLVKQAAANAEAAQIKEMAKKVQPNAA